MDITRFFAPKNPKPPFVPLANPNPPVETPPKTRRSINDVLSHKKLQPSLSFSSSSGVPVQRPMIYDSNGKLDLNASLAYKLDLAPKKRFSEHDLFIKSKKPTKRHSAFDWDPETKKKLSQSDVAAAVQLRSQARINERFLQTLTTEESRQRNAKLHLLNEKLRAGESLLRRMDILREDYSISTGVTNNDLELHGYMREGFHMCIGQGMPNAQLMIIGDYPTKEECENGRAFSGLRASKFKKFLLEAGIDVDSHCYATNVVKINIPNQRYTFEEIEDHLEYLREEINTVRPKQILCVGRLAATVAQNSFRLLDRVRHKNSIFRYGSERQDGVYLENFYEIQKNGDDISAVNFPEFRHVSRVFMMEEIGTFFASQGKEAFRKRWISKLGHLADLMCLERAPYIDLEEELESYHQEQGKGSLDDVAQACGIKFSHPTDQFFPPEKNPKPLPEDYHIGLQRQEKNLRFYLIERVFSENDNCYVLFGRLKEGNTVSVIARNPKFRFYVDHPSFETQYPENGVAVYNRPKLDDILLSLKRILIPHFRSLGFRYSEITEQELWEQIGLKLEYVLKRSAIGFQKFRTTHLEVTFNFQSHCRKIVEYISQILEGCKIEEASISPIKYLNLRTDVTSYSWVEIDPSKLKVPNFYSTSSELEYEVEFFDLQGKRGVKKDEYIPTPENESHARLRTAQFDGEMIKLKSTSGSLPEPEIYPIGRLCVLISDKNDHERPSLMDKVRNPKKDCQRKVTSTGRANYVDCAWFIVGAHEEVEPRKFDPKRLPWIPKKPTLSIRKEFDEKKIACLRSVYKWSKFIQKLIAWYGYVGSWRAKKLLPLSLFNILDSYITDNESSVLQINNTTRKDKEVYTKWRECMRTFNRYWHARREDSAIEDPGIQPPRGLETERIVGSIQFSWNSNQPKCKQFFFKDERSMLASFVEYCRQADIDGFSGHNICNFDMRYIIKRIRVLGLRWDDYWENRGSELISMGRNSYRRRNYLKCLYQDTLSKKVMETTANGKREFTIVNVPGRFVFDTLSWAQKDGPPGLPGYNLNRLAQKILGDRKGDLPFTSIPVQFFTRPDNLSEYCWKDTELCERICNICDVQSFVVVSSRIIDDISLGEFYNTGVQRKNVSIFRTVLRDGGMSKVMPDKNPFSQEENFEDSPDLIGKENNPPGDDEDEEELEEEEEELLGAQKLPEKARQGKKRERFDPKTLFAEEPPKKRLKRRIALYQGARVVKVIKGFYSVPIPTLDFAQLYPSIIISENLGFNTIGRLEHFLSLGYTIDDLWTSGELYPDPWNPGQKCAWYFLKRRRLSKEVAEQLPAFDDQPAGLAQCVKNSDGTYTPRLEVSDYATQLDFLGVLRTHYKRLMVMVGQHHPLYKAYNSAQMAVKVLMNSLYGATGVKTGLLACLPIGASVTCEGRRTLTEVEGWMKDYFQGTIVGGDTDSVFVLFPHLKTLDDTYAEVTMLTDPDKPESETNPPITLPFIEHVVRFINRRQKPAKMVVFEKDLYPFNCHACKKSDYGNCEPERDPVTGKMHFPDREEIPITSKGTENKRRSTAPYAKAIFDKFDSILLGMVKLPLEERLEKSCEYVKSEVKKILAGQFDYSQFVLTSYFGKSEDQYANPNHPTLVINRKRLRRGEEPYQLGERVPRVVVVNSNPKAQMYEKVEDPMYAMLNSIPLDLDYYIDKQLRVPLERKLDNFEGHEQLIEYIFSDVTSARKKLRPGEGLYAYLNKRCEICSELSKDLVCQECRLNLDKDQITAQFEAKKAPLIETIAKQKLVCYDCLGNAKQEGEIDCNNIYCSDLPRRVLPTVALKKLEKMQIEIEKLLDY